MSKGELLKHGRSGAGVVRSVLGLANSVNQDLGADTCAYSDGELMKALDKCGPIRYSIQTKGEVSQIGLSSDKTTTRLRLHDDSLWDTSDEVRDLI